MELLPHSVLWDYMYGYMDLGGVGRGGAKIGFAPFCKAVENLGGISFLFRPTK